MSYVFEGMELDTTLFELRRGGTSVSMEPQAFDVLTYLVAHHDRVVAKEELMDQIWGGRFVSETAVTSRIKQARRAIGDDGAAQRMIRTLHGRGYRFVAQVSEREARPVGAPRTAVRSPLPPVHYTVSDGLDIAYQVTGAGDRDIVLVAGFVSHLDHDWGDPRHAHFLDRLGTMGRLIRFDKRGTGMSGRPPGVPDLETRMHDVLAVLDAVGSTQATLFGYSEGGPMALLCAATHPERVSSLILYGSYAKRTRADDHPWAQTPEDRQAYTDHLLSTWDWEEDMRMRCPSADDAMAAWWAARARAAATPSTVRALMDMNALVDIREMLPAVRVPTLLLHRRGDALLRIEGSRYMAERIPDATMIELDGDDHMVSGNPDQILDPIERFLSEQPAETHVPLVLAAIVGVSGQGAAPMVERLRSSGGRIRRTPAGEPVALFDGPATAVRAGLRWLDRQPDVGLSLHIAEVSRDAEVVSGFAVSTALALAEHAPSGALWASSTARDLLAGSGIALESVGAHDLGVPGLQQVFAASVG